MEQRIVSRTELEEAGAEWVSESQYPELVEEMRTNFVEYRYPSDYRDENPLPEDFEEGVQVETAVLANGSGYMAAFDANGHGDGTGQFYRMD